MAKDNNIAVSASIVNLVSTHGNERVLDLIGKGLKYERSRDKQKTSAKERREYVKLVLAQAEKMGVMEEIEKVAMEEGETTE